VNDRGSVTLWVLALALAMVAFGGLALDLWRVLAVQREAGAVADAAAVAAASGIDEIHYRMTGEIVLDPERAASLGLTSLSHQDADLVEASVLVDPSGASVEVSVTAEIEGGFVAFFTGDDGVLRLTASAVAEPLLVP
jgi:uncharacterized membrane protein